MGLFKWKADTNAFNPDKIKKLSNSETIAKLKKEQLDLMNSEPTGIFYEFEDDEVEKR